jgi:hypothetical protein
MVRNENITDVKLLFYLFFINRTNAQWIDKLIKTFYKDKGDRVLKNMKHIAQQCKEKNIDLSFIDNQLISNLDKNNLIEEHEYLFLIKLVKTIDLISKNNELNELKVNHDYILINDEMNDFYYDKYIEIIITLTKECNIENQLCVFSLLILKDIKTNKYQGTYSSTYNFYLKLLIDIHIQLVDEITKRKLIEFLSKNKAKIIYIFNSQNDDTRIMKLLKIIKNE